jgi:hypothetical protein
MSRVFATEFELDDPRIVMGPFIKAESVAEAKTVAYNYGLIIVGEITNILPEEEPRTIH